MAGNRCPAHIKANGSGAHPLDQPGKGEKGPFFRIGPEDLAGDFADADGLLVNSVEFVHRFPGESAAGGFQAFLESIGLFERIDLADNTIDQVGGHAFGDQFGLQFIGHILSELVEHLDCRFLVLVLYGFVETGISQGIQQVFQGCAAIIVFDLALEEREFGKDEAHDSADFQGDVTQPFPEVVPQILLHGGVDAGAVIIDERVYPGAACGDERFPVLPENVAQGARTDKHFNHFVRELEIAGHDILLGCGGPGSPADHVTLTPRDLPADYAYAPPDSIVGSIRPIREAVKAMTKSGSRQGELQCVYVYIKIIRAGREIVNRKLKKMRNCP